MQLFSGDLGEQFTSRNSFHITASLDSSSKMPAPAAARDGSPGPNRLKSFKNTGKDMDVSEEKLTSLT